MKEWKMKVQKFGGFLTAMMLPNIGAFIAWGLITALFIPNGWIPNEELALLKQPMLIYLIPLLIGSTGGHLVYGKRGSVMGAIATMGVIVGSDIAMFVGAMIMGPLSALLIKKFDKLVDGRIPSGFEMLVNNFSLGIIGMLLCLLGYALIGPVIQTLNGFFAAGVQWLVDKSLLVLVPIFMEPARMLFLNNAISQGIFAPLGVEQAAEMGKSIFFLLSSNPGPGLGLLIAYWLYGKGTAKEAAPSAMIIHFFGGIHEIYFPFILMNPLTVLAAIAGGITGTFLFTLFNVGLVGVSSPGSIVTIMMMASAGDQLLILLAVLASTAVSFLVAAVIVKHSKQNDEDVNKNLKEAAKQMESLKGKKSRISSVFEEKETVTDFRTVKRIVYVCDAGMGSSAMGASVIAKRLRKAGITDITVEHARVMELPDPKADIIVTHVSLRQVAHEKQPDIEIISIEDYLNAPEYDALVNSIEAARS